ncbi:MAG: FixH family protein [Flavobacteriales bacterium]|nr:FixH family protein [Flavobacteriales bacterium]MBP9080440.1 FixH family protein [Flavobacteriales bacterium]
MNWGKALALALISFAAMMAWFMYKASQHPSPLVTEDYYRQELKFQERIDEAARANALSALVDMVVQRGSVQLVFPAEMAGRRITGLLLLQRPDDPRADRTVPLYTDSARFTAATDLAQGRYNAALQWEADGVKYYTQEKVYVP